MDQVYDNNFDDTTYDYRILLYLVFIIVTGNDGKSPFLVTYLARLLRQKPGMKNIHIHIHLQVFVSYIRIHDKLRKHKYKIEKKWARS